MLLNCGMDHPLRFSANTPNVDGSEQKFLLTLCGHACDGNTCYQVSESTDTNAGIHVETMPVHEAAPPMPMLKLTRVPASAVEDGNRFTAEVTLSEPQTADAKSLQIENVELKVRVEALQREIELRAEHEAEVRELTTANTQLAVQVAELVASQQSLQAMMALINEKNQLSVELQATRELLRNQSSPASATLTASPVVQDLIQAVGGLQQEIVTAIGEANNGKSVRLPVPFAVSTSIPVSDQSPAKCECEACASESTCTHEACACGPECGPQTKTCNCTTEAQDCATCVANGNSDAQSTTK
jgi:hypothetical protein